MILQSLRLQNIRSYIDQTITFPEGSVLLSGDIGSGKSTILLALEFALFGIRRTYFPALALLRNGAKEGAVELKLNIDGKEYTIKRTLKRGKNDIAQTPGVLIKDGLAEEATAQELKAKMLEILGYPMSELTKAKDVIYRYTVYTPQEEMKQILSEPTELRLDTLRRVFGIDRYKRIRENAAILTKMLKDKLNISTGETIDLAEKEAFVQQLQEESLHLATKRQEMLPRQEEAKQRLQKAKETIEQLQEALQEGARLRTMLQLQQARLEDTLHRHTQVKNETQVLQLQLQELHKQLQSPLLHPPETDKLKLAQRITEIEASLQKLLQRKTLLEQRIRFADTQLEELDKSIRAQTDLARELRIKQDQAKLLDAEIQEQPALHKELIRLELDLKALSRQTGEQTTKQQIAAEIKERIAQLSACPTCLQEVPVSHRASIVRTQEQVMAELQESLHALHEQHHATEKSKTACTAKMTELTQKAQLLARLHSELATLKAVDKETVERQKQYAVISLEKIKQEYELDTLESDEAVSEELKLLRQQQQALHAFELQLQERKNKEAALAEKERMHKQLQAQLADYQKTIADINRQTLEVKEKMESFLDLQDRRKLAQEAMQRCMDEERELDLRLLTVEKELQNKTAQQELIGKEITKKKGIQAKAKQLNIYVQWIEDHVLPLMGAMERQIMAKVHGEFNEYLQRWFAILMEDESISLRLDDTFAPIIEQNGYETQVDFLSGGEKTAASLAYRLALNKVINDVQSTIKTKDIIILDEPTDGFSSAQLDRVRNVLEQLRVKQVILVSHESKIESFVDHVIRIAKTEQAGSVVG